MHPYSTAPRGTLEAYAGRLAIGRKKLDDILNVEKLVSFLSLLGIIGHL